jgi:hypothetical protein
MELEVCKLIWWQWNMLLSGQEKNWVIFNVQKLLKFLITVHITQFIHEADDDELAHHLPGSYHWSVQK